MTGKGVRALIIQRVLHAGESTFVKLFLDLRQLLHRESCQVDCVLVSVHRQV